MEYPTSQLYFIFSLYFLDLFPQANVYTKYKSFCYHANKLLISMSHKINPNLVHAQKNDEFF